MEDIIQYMIYIHAALGGIALISGGAALIARKGKSIHKRSGKVFYITMLSSAVLALIIAIMPGHENPFLFCIGLFSSYFIITGYRSLKFRRKDHNIKSDKVLAYSLIIVSFIMIAYPPLFNGNLNVVLLVFGVVGLIFGFRDLRFFKHSELLPKKWLRLHLGKMTGGYIAAVTAFLVVNDVLPGLSNWFVPTIIGSIYIGYWMRKIRR